MVSPVLSFNGTSNTPTITSIDNYDMVGGGGNIKKNTKKKKYKNKRSHILKKRLQERKIKKDIIKSIELGEPISEKKLQTVTPKMKSFIKDISKIPNQNSNLFIRRPDTIKDTKHKKTKKPTSKLYRGGKSKSKGNSKSKGKSKKKISTRSFNKARLLLKQQLHKKSHKKSVSPAYIPYPKMSKSQRNKIAEGMRKYHRKCRGMKDS
jgi:hypothetical protein